MLSDPISITNKFKGKDFLTLLDFSKDEIKQLIMLGLDIKKKQKSNIIYQPLKGKTLGMIFEKASTRTRVSFEVGMYQLGGHALFLNNNDLQLKRGETIADTAKVLSRYVDGILMRTDDQNKLIEMSKNSNIPIINGLSDLYHPTQIIADMITIYEEKGKWKDLKLTYVGDGNNVAHSLIIVGAKLGMNIVVATPKEYQPNKEIYNKAKIIADEQGVQLEVVTDVRKAVEDADVIYTDVWTSMGQEQENQIRLKAFKDYQVNESLVKLAKKDYTFMHCLPAHRGEEVTTEVIDGARSVVFDEAENRLHAHKAILTALMS